MTSKRKIIIVEDNSELNYLYREWFNNQRDYILEIAEDYETFRKINFENYDIAVLDLDLGDVSLRSKKDEILKISKIIPVIIVSSCNDYDTIKTFLQGNHSIDFLIKDTSFTELQAKIDIKLNKRTNTWFEIDPLKGELAIKKGRFCNRVFEFRIKELQILNLLHEQESRSINIDLLYDHIWGFKKVDIKKVRVHISAINKILRDTPLLIQISYDEPISVHLIWAQ